MIFFHRIDDIFIVLVNYKIFISNLLVLVTSLLVLCFIFIFLPLNRNTMYISQNYIEAVKAIKGAILRSQYRAAASVNKEQLSLYYGIGQYVSENSRKGFWGKGAIEQISSILQKKLPGLRGFSATSIRNMRIFF